jgi:hypothetical protein
MCGSPLKNESLLGTIYLSADLLRMIPPIGRGGKPLGNGALDEVTYEKRRGFQAGQPHNRLLITDKSQKLCFSCNSQAKNQWAHRCGHELFTMSNYYVPN